MAARDATSVEISVLGPLRARRRGKDVVLGGPRQRAVLARLALAGGSAVSVDRLVDDLWAGEPPPSAVNTLQSYVSNLRRALDAPGDALVERAGATYRLRVADDQLTAVRFEHLVAAASNTAGGTVDQRIAELDEALALWHGGALADFADEDWARGDAVRLEELRLAAMEARFQLLLDSGRHAMIVGDLDAAVGQHPLRERFTAQLVLALYRCGRQAEALRALERTRAHLAEELGLDPGPELARLATAVLDQDESLLAPSSTPPAPTQPTAESATPTAGTSAPVASGEGQPGLAPGSFLGAPAPGPGRGPSGLPLPPAVAERRTRSGFVGRDAEQDALDRQFEAVAGGERRLATINGEPGVGKTRLAQRFATRVHEVGTHVLWGRCTPESLIPYQPVVEALRTALRTTVPEVARALVETLPALSPLLPEVATAGIATVVRAERFELFESFAELVAFVTTDAPVLLVVDDLQWIDEASLALLDHLIRNDRGGRLLVLGTVRRPAGRTTAELDRFLADLRRDGLYEGIDLAGLAAPEVARLLEENGREVDERTAEAVRSRTAGNPFFVESLAEQAVDLVPDDERSMPDSLRDVLDGRIAAVPPDSARVLSAAAVFGERIELGVLGAVVEMSADELLDVVDGAVAAGLLVEDEDLGWVAFPHALVRQGLVARTTRNREARLHVRIADALEARVGFPDGPALVAQHLLAAGRACPPQRAAAAALAAGQRSLELMAPAEARTWSTRARDLLGGETGTEARRLGVEAAMLQASACRHLGDVEPARQAVRQVVAEARLAEDPLLLARAANESALLASGVGFSFGEVDQELLDLLAEALAALPLEHHAERATLLAWSSIALTGEGLSGDLLERQRTLSAEAQDLATDLTDHPDVQALVGLARRLAISGPAGLEERREIWPAMYEAAVAAGSTELEVVSLVFGVVDHLEADDVEGAEAMLDRLRARLHPFGRPMFDTYLYFLEASFALMRGRLDEAEERSALGLATGEVSHRGNATQAWGAQTWMLAWDRGGLADLVPVVESVVEQYPGMPVWRAALASCLAGAGDHAGARAAYAPLLAEGRLDIPDDSLWYPTVGQVAEVAWTVGDQVAAAVVVEALAPYTDRLGVAGMASVCIGPLARQHGLALATLGRLDEAEQELARAAARAEAVGFGTWQARALADRAEVLARRGGPGDAEEAARLRAEGEAIAAELGIQLGLRPA